MLSTLMQQNAVGVHPWPAIRLREITKWAVSEHYNALLEGDYRRAVELTEKDEGSDALILTPGENIGSYMTDIGNFGADLAKTGTQGLAGIWSRLSKTNDDPESDK